MKTNGATFLIMEELGKTFLPGQFWPGLSFSALRHGPSPDFLSCGPKLRSLYCCDMNFSGDEVGR